MAEQPAVKLLIERFGASQIVLGSDYPFVMGDADPVGSVDRVRLDKATWLAITAGNARRFLALE